MGIVSPNMPMLHADDNINDTPLSQSSQSEGSTSPPHGYNFGNSGPIRARSDGSVTAGPRDPINLLGKGFGGGSSTRRRRKLRRNHRRTQYTNKHKRSSKSTKHATIKHRKSYRKHNRTIKRRKSRRHH